MGLFNLLKGFAQKKVAEDVGTEPDMSQQPSQHRSQEYEYIPEPLRKQKAYDMSAQPGCGFDLSAVRRHESEHGEYWAEGANFDRIISDLRKIQPFEDEARRRCPRIPRVIDAAVKLLKPYAVGQDRAFVPFMRFRKEGVWKDDTWNVTVYADVPLVETGGYCLIHLSYREDVDGLYRAAVAKASESKVGWMYAVARSGSKLVLESVKDGGKAVSFTASSKWRA